MEVVASLSQSRTAAAQCGLFTHKSVPVIFEPPCIWNVSYIHVDYFSVGSVNVATFLSRSLISSSQILPTPKRSLSDSCIVHVMVCM